MKKQSFSVKDLINAGLFSLLVFAAMFVGGIIGFIPIFMPFIPFICALCSGPVFMLYSTKIHRFGMVLIMGTIIGLLFMVTGHGIYVLPGTMLLALIGEYILKKGNYESLNHTRWCFTVYSLASGFMMIPIYITRDAYIQRLIDQGYGQAYADQMMSVLPNWTFLPVLLLGAIGGYLGATIGIKMLQKHFKKLGMA
ncbi:MptD family putative ECF transporter S component [Streptococcus gallolyticus subsp. gallolyticus]|uniref:MptD family putative ECF transporter S component n=1 Tax=Streptococcus gallolyticus TaxID=315405 RepID=UPI001F4323B6|nr:MptD family putative ECF transporter S component [Streptococcus gallolyticus]MCF1633318.1 MptD family putative ECF transporter S component [Streptococcus gallolyticus]MCY7201380.1 MptD family putative ECF transporter S component [Streptococcus gallolyticus subsp. gallolyticus]